MKTKVVGSALFLVAGLFCGFHILDDDGVVGQTKKPLHASNFLVKGCFCHGDSASPRVHVWISGPETLAAGAQALYRINVARDSNIAAGFDVAAFYGDLGVYDSLETKLMRIDPFNPVDSLEITHTATKLAGGRDTITWLFWYKAPQTFGIIDTIYGAGNSVDTSLDPAGDFWNYSPNLLVHIANPTAVGEQRVTQSFHLVQNYPNPFNPSTTIQFEMPVAGWACLTVYDVTGRKVRDILNERMSGGLHEAKFVAEESRSLSSGIYLYQLVIETGSTEPFVATKKMLLLK